MTRATAFACGVLAVVITPGPTAVGSAQTSGGPLDLSKLLAAGTLRAVNREATPLKGDRQGVHVSENAGNGVVWVEGTDFSQGTIEVDIRGRDVLQRSFVGIAFHRKDDTTYEAVYLRPFNFRSDDPVRREHAVQYISIPDYDWPRLRKEFPEEFESPVDRSLDPTGWVPLRIVVAGQTVQVYAGKVNAPTLEVRKLGALERGAIGLFTGNGSDGDFANLRVTPAK